MMRFGPSKPARDRRAPWLGWRAALGCLTVLAAVMAATAVVGLGQVHQLTHYLSESKSVKVKHGVLAPDAGLGGAETILLVGNDTRSGQSAYKDYSGIVPSLANESLLVRLDPAQKWISMLSIPRELLTTIDCPSPTGIVQNRFNYSLACGGFTTLVSTIKQITGLSVNHVVMINFENFEQAIDEIGCVYYQVDNRYYHVNVPGGAQYQQINLQPGYQKLCGTQAEQFVSFRHADTSLVRDARDQSFLLAARQQYGPTLIDNISKFERIFGQLVQADAGLKTTTGIEDLVAALVGAAGLPVRQVQVPDIDYSPTMPAAISCNCVTAPPSALAEAAHSFLYGTFVAPTRHEASSLAHVSHHAGAALALSPTTSAESAPAVAMQAHLPLRIEYPRVQLAAGVGTMAPELRGYEIHAPNGTPYPAFVEVFPVGLLGQYYDVEGTTWTGAPALSGATQSVVVGGTTYSLAYTGAHIDQVAWTENNAAYWVHNSLTDGVSNAQMLAIAEQTAPVTGPVPLARRHLTLSVHVHAVPKPVAVAAGNGTNRIEEIGVLVGGAVILALAGALIIRRRRLAEQRRRRGELDERIRALEAGLARVEGTRGSAPATASARQTTPGSARQTTPGSARPMPRQRL